MSCISTAQASGLSPASGFDPLSLLPFVLIIVIFYFLIFRPQQKRMKQQKEMLSSLRRGDRVVTTGGIFGTINRLENEQEVYVEIAPDVVIRVNRSSIADIVSKPDVEQPSKASAQSSSSAPLEEPKSLPSKKSPAKAGAAKTQKKAKLSKPTPSK